MPVKEKVPVAPVAVSVARVTVPLRPSKPGGAAGIKTPASNASDEYVPTTAGTVTTTSTYCPVKLFVPSIFNLPEGKAELTPIFVTQTEMATHDAPSMVALMELREGVVGEMPITARPDFPWYVAMIVTVPEVTAVTSPPEVTVAPTERACHVAVADTFCVAPSEKVAVAVSWTVWPMLVKSVDPFTATDDTVADEGAVELDDEPPHDHETTSATRTRIRRAVPGAADDKVEVGAVGIAGGGPAQPTGRNASADPRIVDGLTMESSLKERSSLACVSRIHLGNVRSGLGPVPTVTGPDRATSV